MKRILSGVLAGIAVLALTAGCAGQQVGPKLEIVRAVQDFATADRAGFTLRAGGRVEDLIAVAVADGSTVTAADARVLRKIYRSSLTFAWDRAGDDKFLAKAVIDGVGAEVRVIGGVTYVRVPIRKLAAKFGASKGQIAGIRQMLGPANPGVNQLVGGGWVWISAADMKRFTQTLDPAPQPGTEQLKLYAQLMISVQNLFNSADVAVDAKDETHLTVTTSTVKAYREGKRLLQAMKKIADKPTADMLDKTLGADLNKAPEDRPIVLDLWIDNGRLKAFEFNFLQFVKGNTGRASLRIDFSRGRDILVPRPATKLDPNKILSGIGAPRARAWAELVG